MSVHRVALFFSPEELYVRESLGGAEIYTRADLFIARFADAAAAHEYLELLEQAQRHARTYELRTDRGFPIRSVRNGREIC